MALLNYQAYTKLSFRNQLFVFFTVGVLALSISASLVTAMFASNQVREFMVTEGIQITDSLKDQSLLAFLYASSESANDVIQPMLSFPGVNYVMLLDRDMSVIDAQGVSKPTIKIAAIDLHGSAQLVFENKNEWHFAAPVYTPGTNDNAPDPLYEHLAPDQEMLGYVYLTMRKDGLKRMETVTFFNNMTTALIFAFVLLLILHFILKKMTSPLDVLSGLMGRAEKGHAPKYATLEGPKEIVSIAKAFNRMIEAIAERDKKLRDHNVTLEAQVALRTHELVQARDLALEASRNKSEFLANVSHELRTPLQSIIGYADMVIESLRDEQLFEFCDDVERIIHNADHLLALINTILDFAKAESGSIELHITDVDLTLLLQKAREGIQPIAAANGNNLTVNLDNSVPVIRGDASKLLQILINLLGNAAKFTQDGEIDVSCRVDNSELFLIVADTGVGMDEDKQKYIFDPFRQLDGSDTRKFQGTGLGLAIVKRYCHVMGGDVFVESRLGEGSKFTVRIPLDYQA